jgi:TM2 domain-containing membrane protein YozV
MEEMYVSEPNGSSTSATSSTSTPQAPPAPSIVANPLLAAVLAWLVPGAGHLFLKRGRRAFLFFVLVLAALVIGCRLDGNLYVPVEGQPLTLLATVGCMGMGLPYFVLRYLLDYHGEVMAAGYEYGTAFILTAGLMNLLLVLDAWDIALGKKE